MDEIALKPKDGLKSFVANRLCRQQLFVAGLLNSNAIVEPHDAERFGCLYVAFTKTNSKNKSQNRIK